MAKFQNQKISKSYWNNQHLLTIIPWWQVHIVPLVIPDDFLQENFSTLWHDQFVLCRIGRFQGADILLPQQDIHIFAIPPLGDDEANVGHGLDVMCSLDLVLVGFHSSCNHMISIL